MTGLPPPIPVPQDVSGFVRPLVAPERCFLLVIDKQRWFCGKESPFHTGRQLVDATRRVSNADMLIEAARTSGVPVIWTQTTEGDPDRAPANALELWERQAGEPRLRQDDYAFGFEGLGPLASERVHVKHQPDPFSVSEFVESLRSTSRDTAVLCGAYAARCVLVTAAGAFRHGFNVVAASDAVLPHPMCSGEQEVFEAVVTTTMGSVVRAGDLAAHWRKAQQPVRPLLREPLGADCTQLTAAHSH